MKDYFNRPEILELINNGDNEAFLKMYDFYAPRLFRHIYYRISSKEAAQDLTQQIFLKTWQYICQSGNKIDNLNAFLYRTANNLVIDYYRRSERKNILIDENLEKKLTADTSYINEIEKNLEMIRVRKGINKLNSEQQQLIYWRYIDELTIDQIAKISGWSKNAVYVGIHRALKELKKII